MILFNILSALRDICWPHCQSEAPALTSPVKRVATKSEEDKESTVKEGGRWKKGAHVIGRNDRLSKNDTAHYHTQSAM